MEEAKIKGANRAVITGGGEPTLYPDGKLKSLIALASSHFPEKVVIITNGFNLARMELDKRIEELESLYSHGLTTLAISRHHWSGSQNAEIMSIDIEVERILNTFSDFGERFSGISPRLICVLQKGGIETVEDVERYVEWASSLGVSQVCFKELYVSTSTESEYHSEPGNVWSQQHQVSLKVVLDFFEANGWGMASKLPWGSPIHEGEMNGVPMQVAAYTEPSLFWELSNKLCRSWNIMADGRCLTSLEDRKSEIYAS